MGIVHVFNGRSESGQATGPYPETKSWYLITNAEALVHSRSLTEQKELYV
jgi:hypothetical protein